MVQLPPMESFDTTNVLPESRIGFWQDLVSRKTAPVSFDSCDADEIHCKLLSCQVERFSFSHSQTSQIKIFRGKEHTKKARGSSYLYLQLDGEGEFLCHGSTQRTGAGSIILFDETTPYRFRAVSPVRTLAVGIPSTLIAAKLPGYRDVAMQVIDGNEGASSVLQATIRSMDSLLIRQELRTFSRSMFHGVIELLAASLDDREEDCAVNAPAMTRWAGKVRQYVEANLDDPNLSPATIANEFCISPRYLRLIFADSGNEHQKEETLRRFILRRRLEECADRLAEPEFRYASITDLAHGWGFSDSSYFARRFTEYFGLAPRAFRNDRLAHPSDEKGVQDA